MPDRKDEIVALLRELAELTILDEASPQSFRARAYENAMHELKGLGGAIEAMSVADLVKLPGIGKSTAQKIREYLDSGRIEKLEKLRAKFPPAYRELSHIPGLGPKTLARLRAELGVEDIEGLRAAIATQRLRELKGLGEKVEQNLTRAIERLGLGGKDRRTPIADALPVARRLIATLAELEVVEESCYCGSLRRMSETIGDIDLLCSADNAGPIMEAFVALPGVDDIVARGDTKTSVLVSGGMQVDLRVVEPDQFGAAQLYFTGSKAHNIKVRQLAIKRGWTLNEYGLSDVESGKVLASRTEEEIYRALDLCWVPPSLREDTGEVEAAAEDRLPQLAISDIRGDLHVHTTLSGDGRSDLDEVVAAALARNYEYLAITDHGEDLAINGVNRDGLLEQRKMLAAITKKNPTLTLLSGCELNIGPKGELDYDAEFRAGMDFAIAAVHSHFDLDKNAQTSRILRAMEDPAIQAIAHLTGRRIGRRPGIDIDVDAVLAGAAETGVAIEINCSLARLDAAADVLRRARDLDVTFVLSTDAHHVSELDRNVAGVEHALRGWVDRERVANTWPRERFLAWTRRRKQQSHR